MEHYLAENRHLLGLWMPQWVKCLLHKPEDLMMGLNSLHAGGRVEMGRSQGFPVLLVQLKWEAPGSMRLRLQNLGWGVIKGDTRVILLTSTHMYPSPGEAVAGGS